MIGPEWIWLVLIFALGCCIGSFLNVVVYRLPRDKSLVTPPSSCPSCERHIRFYDNIAVGYRAGHNIDAGSKNIFIGTNAGGGIRSGQNNVIIGTNVADDEINSSIDN